MRILYSLLFYLLVPFILLRLLWRAIKSPAYAKRWSERFGFVAPFSSDKNSSDKKSSKKVIWFHTVSVGEFIAALPLIRRLQENPNYQILVTTTTPTGSERVQKTLGNSVAHVYAPYDLPDVIERFIRRVNPAALIFMETELWPNWIAHCAKHNIPRILVNARMSEKSAQGYDKLSSLTQPMLAKLSLCLVQNAQDASRLVGLGLPENKMQITGNIKFDLTLSEQLKTSAQSLKSILCARQQKSKLKRFIWIAASTHAGEDEVILNAHAQLIKNPTLKETLLILVPRHPERFASVTDLAESKKFNVIQRSEQNTGKLSVEKIAQAQVMLGDTMGELLLLYGASDIAFVGGSLVPNGGHNLIEPAVWQLPILSGEHLYNFAEVSRLLLEANALTIVRDATQLAESIESLLLNEELRVNQGNRAFRVAEANRGALDRTIAAIQPFID